MPIPNLLALRAGIPGVAAEVIRRNGSPSQPNRDRVTSVDDDVEHPAESVAAEVERLERARREAEVEEVRARTRADAAREEAEREEARAAALREETARLEEILFEAARARAIQQSHPATVENRRDDKPVGDLPVHDGHAYEPSPRCMIRFWRGYRKGAFYAESDAFGEEGTVAESASFRARGNGVPEQTDEAAAAYAALVEQLERDGWRRVATGSDWFEATFER